VVALKHSKIAEDSVQDALVVRLAETDLGWEFVEGDSLRRALDDVLIEEDLLQALIRLNVVIAEQPERAQEVIRRLRAVILSVANDGLLAANEEMVAWLCGRRTIRFVETEDYVPIRLIDFDDPRTNKRVVSLEVVFPSERGGCRYDVVLYVNGFPLVVGETKTPVSESKSWLDGANDIHFTYEDKTPAFFVPNVLSFATEGKEFRYGAVSQPPETWMPWFRTTDDIALPSIASVLHSAAMLLAPEMLLDILRNYTMYSRRSSTTGGYMMKILPRYPQVEAVEAIVARVLDTGRRQGLIWHHQGSGKTLLMAFAAAKMRLTMALDAPTILVVLDRLDLIEQLSSEFASVGIPTLRVAETKDDLRRMLLDDARGVIVTTIFRFADAGMLNERENIVVMVDEAHRTQEGRLGLDMRVALPNARFIGLTGTPISTADRNTWTTFGDPDDPEGVLNHYTVERSIADGATVPIHVETRLIDFHIDRTALDEAFDELAETEGLDEREAGILSKRASRVDRILKAPERVQAVAGDIVEHHRRKLAPLGLKAQVVAFDRELCVAYYDAISTLLVDGEEATVVMTTVKGDPPEWRRWDLEREDEAKIKDRFRDVDDPLKFVIVTAKFLVGFDAPIEGVMYLDKPLRAHTLFQAVCRTNRRWTNPHTGQEKLYGLVVDYVGIGEELAKAVAVKDIGARKAMPAEVDELLALLGEYVGTCLGRFEGVDRRATGFEQLYQAQERLSTQADRDEFAADFVRAQGLFEFLWPDTRLRAIESDYKWLTRIYKSVMPTDAADRLLWQRLGAKTAALIDEHVTGFSVDRAGLETVAIDAEVFETLRQLELFPREVLEGPEPPTIDDVMNHLETRIRRKLEGPKTHPVWRNLSERLEDLRRARIETAAASVEFLKRLLQIAADLVAAEKAEEEGSLDEIRVVDPDRGALTQILEEYAPPHVPVIIETVVERIDEIVRPIRGTGWQESHPGDRAVRQELRRVLRDNALPPQGEIFDRAYAYIREHY
jgi:type I restriction enzyme R subunit